METVIQLKAQKKASKWTVLSYWCFFLQYVDILFVPFDYSCISFVCQLHQAETLFAFLQLLVKLTLFLYK